MALLALAATQTTKIDVCPSDEMLGLLVSNNLKGQARERLLAHLNSCSHCYRSWLEAACHVSALETAAPKSPRRWSLAGLWQYVGRLLVGWPVAIPATAVALLVSLVVLWPRSPDLGARIDESYAAATAEQGARIAQAAAALPLPWESAALAFDSVPVEPAAQAFGAGLWAARGELSDAVGDPLPEELAPSGARSWLETEWAVYQALGRWTVLVWALAQLPNSQPAWTEHIQIIEVMRAKLTERSADEDAAGLALAALDDIQPLLEDADKSRSDLSHALLITMQQLAPRNL